MKKVFVFILCFVCYIISWGITFAGYDVSDDIKSKIDPLMSIADGQWKKESIDNQISRYEKLVDSFKDLTIQGDKKEMIDYLLYLCDQKIKILKSQLINQKDIIGNVDWDVVQETWLSWHNAERTKKGLQAYTYNDLLNYSALTWAQQIANEMRKTGSTHKRNAGDGYYSYNSIKERFSNLGINVVYFSESNAYGSYNCSKADCTQEMLSILKKCFDRTYMNSGHYPAIVNQSYKQIGIGVAINNGWIWVTTHYAADIN